MFVECEKWAGQPRQRADSTRRDRNISVTSTWLHLMTTIEGLFSLAAFVAD